MMMLEGWRVDNAGDLCVGNVLDGVGATGVFGDGDIVIVGGRGRTGL